jgi:dipeptidase E
MTARRPQIVAFGGGGFSLESANTLLDDHVLSLTGVARPRVCFLPTASGDADHYIVRFYRAFNASRCEPSHLSLFRREASIPNPRAHLLAQDVIYVGGGSVVSLLGTWRAHELDSALREAWLSGVLLCGGSAGSLCWFSEAVSGFHTGEPRLVRGLGFLPWSNAVHYDAEPGRREAFHRAIAGGMADGYAAGDCTALHFVGGELTEAIASRPDARAYFVGTDADGRVFERALAPRYLGTEPSEALLEAGAADEPVVMAA